MTKGEGDRARSKKTRARAAIVLVVSSAGIAGASLLVGCPASLVKFSAEAVDAVDAGRDAAITCASGETLCEGICVDLTTSPTNCGHCGTSCGALRCVASACTCVEGTSCAGEAGTGICHLGACSAGCEIDGGYVASGGVDAVDSCQVCDPHASAATWSSVAAGTSCDDGGICNAAAACVSGCFVDGAVYASGAANPSNGCQICDPSKTTTAWSTAADGAACGTGAICAGATCTPTSCAAVLTATPAATSGMYTVALSGTSPAQTLTVYCMMTSGGGWTEVYDQNDAVSGSYQPVASWTAATGLNPTMPNAGAYSILFAIPYLKSGTNYDFLLAWPASPQSGSVQWSQVENPLTASTSANPTVIAGSVVMNPTEQEGDYGSASFAGLRPDRCGAWALTGDNLNPSVCDDWWAVGASAAYLGGGIPSYQVSQAGSNNVGTPHATLYVR